MKLVGGVDLAKPGHEVIRIRFDPDGEARGQAMIYGFDFLRRCVRIAVDVAWRGHIETVLEFVTEQEMYREILNRDTAVTDAIARRIRDAGERALLGARDLALAEDRWEGEGGR